LVKTELSLRLPFVCILLKMYKNYSLGINMKPK
jgi:hypothetical protein